MTESADKVNEAEKKRETFADKLHRLKANSRAARRAGNKAAAAAFRAGAKRMQRRIKGLPKAPAPQASPAG